MHIHDIGSGGPGDNQVSQFVKQGVGVVLVKVVLW